MARQSLTFGTFPSREAFDEAFNAECPKGLTVENDKLLGTCTLTCEQTWELLHGLTADLGTCSTGDSLSRIHTAREWWRDFRNEDAELRYATASAVMGCIGFEWV